MKKIQILIMVLLSSSLAVLSQNQIKIGIGYNGEQITHPGALVNFEYEKIFTKEFSSPLKAELAYYNHPDYHALTVELQKGVRRYFDQGLFLEQALGFGIISKDFKEDSYWYQDEYGTVYAHGNKAVWSLMPTVSFGAGFDLSGEKDHSTLIWVKPKVYWDLGFRPLHLPHYALQIGFTKTIKTK